MYKVTRLENGLTVATAEMPHMASVSLGIWVGVGGRYEPAALSGVSHFIEHLLFKGTQRRSAREISQAVEGIGGYLNAFTSEEHTCFYAKARHDQFAPVLEVLADMFLHSTFDPVEMDKEREVIKEELAMYMDQPQQYVQELLNATMWPDQPLGRSITGTAKTLDASAASSCSIIKGKITSPRPPCWRWAAGSRTREALAALAKYARKFTPGPRPGYAPAVPRKPSPPCASAPKRPSKRRSPWASAPVRAMTNGVTPCACSMPSWAKT